MFEQRNGGVKTTTSFLEMLVLNDPKLKVIRGRGKKDVMKRNEGGL